MKATHIVTLLVEVELRAEIYEMLEILGDKVEIKSIEKIDREQTKLIKEIE